MDYIIANGKAANAIQDSLVLRGCDMSSDHYIVRSKIRLLYSRWKRLKTHILKQEGQIRYKVHSLQEKSIRSLYERRLTRCLNEIATHSDIDTECENNKQCIHKAAYEVFGESLPYRKKNGLKI